jgi:rhamnulokinase
MFPSFLAFDLGAESGRTVLGQLEGNLVRITELSRFPNNMLSLHGHLCWDIFRLYEEMKKGLKICAGGSRIQSIAVDTWGVDFGLLAKGGTILGLPFTYRDSFSSGAMEKLFKRFPREKIYQLTGIQFLPFNSLFQLFALKEKESSSLEAAEDLLFIPDIFHYFLTGKKCTEFTFATTSQLYNPLKGSWEKEFFEVLDVPQSLMQEILQPGTVIGEMNKDISQHVGWKPVPVVAVASHDTGSAVAAVPAHGQDWAYISSGTWSLMGIETKKPIINDLSLFLNFTNEGGVGGTFRFLKNISGLWLLQRCRKSWAINKDYSYQELTEMGAKAKAFRSLINPDREDFLNPPEMLDSIKKYCLKSSQPAPESPAQYVRCILESLALKYRFVLDQLRTLSPRPIRRIHIIGGGVKNRLLCQFTANATKLPVVAGPAEAAAVGNIMMQALTLGYVSSVSQMREVIRNSFSMEDYQPRHSELWDRAYERYKNILGSE